MTTALIAHSACLEHDPGYRHPESPARLETILRALDAPEFQLLCRLEAPRAGADLLTRAHSGRLVETILGPLNEQAQLEGRSFIDADTSMSAGSAEAALRAAGAAVLAVDEVASGNISNAFCAVRPPGHHAERDRAMGFCLFNNVAIGACRARELGFDRVAVVDFDVHHGNGTQDIFWEDPGALYISTHQMPLYPGTGGRNERGASGNIVNIPLPPGAGGLELRAAFQALVIPSLEQFRADFLFISAGFDAHLRDPLANLAFTEDDFAWATRALCEYAARACDGRVVSTLEGGYDLAALARSASAHVRVLMEF
jgi:acetoin utilization deacetylase AcuC-like enzyme